MTQKLDEKVANTEQLLSAMITDKKIKGKGVSDRNFAIKATHTFLAHYGMRTP